MTDLALGLQTALFVKLSAAVTLAPVSEHIAQDAPLPYVAIAEDVIEDQSTKDSRFEHHTFTIATYFEGEGKMTMRQIQEQVRAALVDQSLTAAGCLFSPPKLLSVEDGIIDGGDDASAPIYVGTQKFSSWAQPA